MKKLIKDKKRRGEGMKKRQRKTGRRYTRIIKNDAKNDGETKGRLMKDKKGEGRTRDTRMIKDSWEK